jgi:hypothetical protein
VAFLFALVASLWWALPHVTYGKFGTVALPAFAFPGFVLLLLYAWLFNRAPLFGLANTLRQPWFRAKLGLLIVATLTFFYGFVA